VELQSVKNTKSFKDKSKLYLFYNTHDMSGTLGNDCGATLRATLSALQKFGVCDESLWPYNIAKCWVKPSQACYDQAKAFTIKSYKYLPSGDVSFAKGMIAAGYPIVFGADVFSSLMSPMISITSVLRMPDSGEKTQGGHCMCVVGASDSKKMFLIKNSWGAEWTPIGGYFWMPYRYWEEFTWDPWVVVL
jgi:C1A family cysteine protease